MGMCWAGACTPWGSRSTLSSRASSVRVREAKGSFPTDSSKEVSQMSSSSSCMRGTRHLHRSWTVPDIVGGAPDHSAQCCRALASAKVCSFLPGTLKLALWYKVLPPGTAQARWGIPPACFVVLGCWQPKTCSLLFCQLLYLGTAELSWTKGLELQSPAWRLTSLSQVGPDPVYGPCHWVW